MKSQGAQGGGGGFGGSRGLGLGLESGGTSLGFITPFSSRVDLPGLASSKQQQASKQHSRNGQKPQLCRGALDSAAILVDDAYRCEGQSDKFIARNSMLTGSQVADHVFKNSQKS